MKHEEIMELILDHYKHPRNQGAIVDAPIAQDGGNPGCGDLVTIYIDADEDGVVKRLGFTGEGCMVSQAGVSIVLEKAKGLTMSEIEQLPADVITEVLGKRLVTTRPACAYLGFNTLKSAVKSWRNKALSDSI